MLKTRDGIKLRLNTIGSSGLVIEIDHWPNSNSFQRAIEVLVTMPTPDATPAEAQSSVSIMHCVSVNYTEAIALHKAFGIGLELVPALESWAHGARKAIDTVTGFGYVAHSRACDEQLKAVCRIADISVQ